MYIYIVDKMIVIITKPHPTWHTDEVHISGFVVRNICEFPPNEWDDDDDGGGGGGGGDDDDIPYWLSYFPLPLKPPTR